MGFGWRAHCCRKVPRGSVRHSSIVSLRARC
jgi:hypothetical protein